MIKDAADWYIVLIAGFLASDTATNEMNIHPRINALGIAVKPKDKFDSTVQ